MEGSPLLPGTRTTIFSRPAIPTRMETITRVIHVILIGGRKGVMIKKKVATKIVIEIGKGGIGMKGWNLVMIDTQEARGIEATAEKEVTIDIVIGVMGEVEIEIGAVMIMTVATTVIVKDVIDTGLDLVQMEGQGAILGDVLAQDPSQERLEESVHLVLTWFHQAQL